MTGVKCDRASAQAAAFRDGAGLAPSSWRVLHIPPFGGDYAMGWQVQPDGALWHNGSNTLWYASAQFDSQRGVAAAAANDGDLEKTASAVERARRAAAAV